MRELITRPPLSFAPVIAGLKIITELSSEVSASFRDKIENAKEISFSLGDPFSLSSSSSSSFILLLFYHVLENASINRIGRSFPSPPIYYTRAFEKCVYKQNLRDILGGRNLLSLLPLPFLSPATFITRV